MKKVIVYAMAMMLLAISSASAATLPAKWDAVPGATGYRVYMSIDLGKTWVKIDKDITGTTLTISNVPDTGLVLFRVGAFDTNGEAITMECGSWYNGSWKLLGNPYYLGTGR